MAHQPAHPTPLPGTPVTRQGVTLTVKPNGLTNGLNAAHRRKNGFFAQYTVVGVVGGQIAQMADLRLYQPASVCYACLWVNGGSHPSGSSGNAGGYGYHKASSALSTALENMGVATKGLSMVGESAMEDALLALPELLGFWPGVEMVRLIKAHE